MIKSKSVSHKSKQLSVRRWAGLVTIAVLLIGTAVWWSNYSSSFDNSRRPWTYTPDTAVKNKLVYGSSGKMFSVDTATGERKELPITFQYAHFAISHDGKSIAYNKDGALVVTSLADGTPKTIIPDETDATVSVRAWSPDDRYILYDWEHRKPRPKDVSPSAPWCVKGDCVDARELRYVSKNGGSGRAFHPQNDYEKMIADIGNGPVNEYFDVLTQRTRRLVETTRVYSTAVAVSPRGTYKVLPEEVTNSDQTSGCDYYEVTSASTVGNKIASSGYYCTKPLLWKDDNSFVFIKSTGPAQKKRNASGVEVTYQPTAIVLYNIATKQEDTLLKSNDATGEKLTIMAGNESHLVILREHTSTAGNETPSALEAIEYNTKKITTLDSQAISVQIIGWAT